MAWTWTVPYMTVTHLDENSMKMIRKPPFRSWLVFFGVIAAGAYCAYESRSLKLGSFYFACGVMLAHVAMDRWEECQLNKAKNSVRVFHRTLYDVILGRQPARCVVSHLSEVMDIRVESETLKYAGTTYNVALVFDTGFSLGLTSAGTYGNREIQDKLAVEIRTFLGLKSSIEIMESIDALIDEKIARSGPPPGMSAESVGTVGSGSAKSSGRQRKKKE